MPSLTNWSIGRNRSYKGCLKYCRTEGRAAKTPIKYREVLERVIALAEETGRKSVLGIDRTFLDDYRHRRVDAGRTPKTVYNETMIIRQLVNFATSRKLIAADPLEGLKVREPKPHTQPCWTPDEVEQILQAADREPHRSALLMLAKTGMRIGELKWLTWEDVDLVRNVLSVRAKEGWRPKSGDQRTVPISSAVRTVLADLPDDGRWVLCTPPSARYPRKGRQISERRLLGYLKRILKRLGFRGHLHTFRHSFIGRALTAGIPEAVVRNWVGHVDQATLKLYTHIADAESQSAMQRLAEADPISQNCQDQDKEPTDAADKKDPKSAQFQHTAQEQQNGNDARHYPSASYDDIFFSKRREGDSNPRSRFPGTRHFQCRTIGHSVISPSLIFPGLLGAPPSNVICSTPGRSKTRTRDSVYQIPPQGQISDSPLKVSSLSSAGAVSIHMQLPCSSHRPGPGQAITPVSHILITPFSGGATLCGSGNPASVLPFG